MFGFAHNGIAKRSSHSGYVIASVFLSQYALCITSLEIVVCNLWHFIGPCMLRIIILALVACPVCEYHDKPYWSLFIHTRLFKTGTEADEDAKEADEDAKEAAAKEADQDAQATREDASYKYISIWKPQSPTPRGWLQAK